MDFSVIIPTFGRPEKLAACLRGLANQSLPQDRYEVLVGFDGSDETAERHAIHAWGDRPGLHLVTCPKQGLNATRNQVLAQARGRILISMNDDVYPKPGFLDAHLRAHDGKTAIVVGYSPFLRYNGQTIFDEMCRCTSLIFFYDQMVDPDTDVPRDSNRDRDWGFRHCWGLNFSAPLSPIRDTGGFLSFPHQYGYDDIEVAHRLRQSLGTPVLFCPEARADHDHRYTPREVLLREFKLGISAWHFAGVAPGFAREVFGRDIRADAEIAHAREAIAAEPPALRDVEREFLASGRELAAGLDVAALSARVADLYQRQRELKRSIWRRGLLHAAIAGPEYQPPPEPPAP